MVTSSTRLPTLQISYADPDGGWEGYLVLDRLVDGLAAGGLRVTPTVEPSEVRELARVMTLKNRVMGLPLGGGKSGVRYDPKSNRLADVLVRFFEHVGPISQSMYGWGPDMNTPPDLCDEVAQRAGLQSRHMALARKAPRGEEGVKRYDRALRERVGPLTVCDARTAIGVVGAAEEAAKVLGLPSSLRIAVHGFGSVGAGTAHFFQERGHRVVGVADAGGYYRDSSGLDFLQLFEAKDERSEIDPDRLPSGLRAGDPEAIFDDECDVLVLAAVKHAIDPKRATDVRAKMVVQGGNLAVTPDAEPILDQRGIVSVPDFLASGGAIATVGGIILLDWDPEPMALLQRIESTIRRAVNRAAQEAGEHGIPLREAALHQLADDPPDPQK
jgi:glutamate dehydrogenase (NAD(P)+)